MDEKRSIQLANSVRAVVLLTNGLQRFPPRFKVLCPISHTEGGNIKSVRLRLIKVETDFYIMAAQSFALTQLCVSLNSATYCESGAATYHWD